MGIKISLNDTIPTKTALAIIFMQGAANIAIVCNSVNKANVILKDQAERLAIYKETTDFLLDNADDATLLTLNKNLDYWRIIRGIDPPNANS